ncbi:hypothetical protein [Klebsiella pneumoniae]|uniref:hypothetical protein n=1 Tax=Klebsiella pneumoniae TaxID=573 RepID=UPI001BD17315|nr:hypothetical protein [Klebsiella pneumoniae]MBS4517628.1 hypothetical protein [Klebsiella pneumoniae]
MNRENTDMEAEKLLDNMDLSLDDEEQQSDEDTTFTHPEIDAFDNAKLYDERITDEAFYGFK